MPEISVIIPVYNASNYLSECLDSILAQIFQDIEIICINDGSTDDSLNILKEYQGRDKRIKIIDQFNKGVSAARNAGLKIASGKYIGFVDADDSIETDYFKKLYQRARQTDANALFSRMSPADDFSRFPLSLSGKEMSQKLIPVFLREDSLNAVWNKIYRREVITTNGILFPVGVKQGEDALFNIEFLMHAKTIAFLDYCGYHYREVEGSATRNVAAHDYLTRIIEVYKTDWTPIIGNTLDQSEMMKLKKIRLVNAVISLIYIYGNRGNSFTDRQRMRKLKEIVTATQIQAVFREGEMKNLLQLNRYSEWIFDGIRKQHIILLYLLTQYSYYRNR